MGYCSLHYRANQFKFFQYIKLIYLILKYTCRFSYDCFKRPLQLIIPSIFLSLPCPMTYACFILLVTFYLFPLYMTAYCLPSMEDSPFPQFLPSFPVSVAFPNQTHISKTSRLTSTHEKKNMQCLSYWVSIVSLRMIVYSSIYL